MKLHINWKKTAFILLDIVLAGYLCMAMTSFNRPDETAKVCTKVSINIADENTHGFLSPQEIKSILEKRKLYPLNKKIQTVNPRDIEDALKNSSFVNTCECYKTQDGHVCVNITQRLPIIRIKNNRGEDYYLDDKGGIMPNSKYTSDLIIATGNISQSYARNTLVYLAQSLMASQLWKNQIEQIHILQDQGVELVPRVGEHIIYIGSLPQAETAQARKVAIAQFFENKMERLEMFYRYGLSEAGWNKYNYINLEFNNQIICKKKETKTI